MATITVTTLDDIVDAGDGEISLREAITQANGDAAADVIKFAPGLSGTIRIGTAEMSVSNDLTINADNRITITGDVNGDDTLTATGLTDSEASTIAQLDDNTRIFNLSNSAALTLNGITITGGYSSYSGGAITTATGTTLNINDSYLAGNTAYFDDSVFASLGGAIRSRGELNITNSTLSGNRAEGERSGGGAIEASGNTTLTNVTLANNHAEYNGGALTIGGGGTLTLNHVTITGNFAGANGGGIFAQVASETITNSLIIGNEAGNATKEIYGGGINFTGLNIIGENATDFDASGEANVINGTTSDLFAVTAANGASTAGVLGDNGGPVPTVALAHTPTNPAIDSVTTGFTGNAANGVPRTINLFNIGSGGFADIGAFEMADQVAIGPTPVFNVTVDENTTSIIDLDFFDPVDSEGGGIFMTKIFTLDGSLASLNGSTGELSFTAAPDFESPGDFDGDNTYSFLVAAFDSDSLFNIVRVNATVTNVIDNDGDDLTGTPGNDTIDALGGNDTVLGLAGDDLLIGQSGRDLLNGGADNDELRGGSNNDTLIGFTGNDTLLGGGGGDSLVSGGGNDELRGGSGDDTIKGGGRADRLFGEKGTDILTGNKGADSFMFTKVSDSGKGAANRDVITDFKKGTDVIDLSAIDAKTGSGNQAFTFIGTAGFSGTKGELRYVKKTNLTLVQGDTDGDGKTDLEIQLDGAINLSALDFVL